MSPALPTTLAALDFQDLFGLAVFALVVLGQILKGAQKKPGTPKVPAPRPSGDTSRNAPAAEPMTRPEGPARPDPWRRAPGSPSRPTAPPRARERLVPQAPAGRPGTLESRRGAPGDLRGLPDELGGALPTADDMPGAHASAHHERLVDLGATSIRSSRHPGHAPTAAAAPKQRRLVHQGRALLGSGLEGRDRLRGAFAWSVVLGRPKAATFGRPSQRP